MVRLEELAQAALAGDALTVRSLAQDLMRQHPRFAQYPRPSSNDAQVLAVAAAVVELLAERMGQNPPAWTAEIGPVSQPRYLVRSAATMRRLRAMCEAESPAPLRRRNLYAPANYLQFA